MPTSDDHRQAHRPAPPTAAGLGPAQGPVAVWLTAAAGTADLVLAEARALAGDDFRLGPGGVHGRCDLAAVYRLCLGARVASRVLVPLAAANDVGDADALWRHTHQLPWEEHLHDAATFAVEVALARAAIANHLWALQRCKDAIVDRLVSRRGCRPAVDRQAPDLRVVVHLRGRQARWSLDLAGPLHRRGGGRAPAPAPLRETAAAAMLVRAGWPRPCPLLDPMCGSGSLLVEAALLSLDQDPGLGWADPSRPARAPGWRGHDPEAWRQAIASAQIRAEAGWARCRGQLAIGGSDADPAAVAAAADRLRRAGLADWVEVRQADLADCRAPRAGGAPAALGWVVTNPPYGHRLGDEATALTGYARLGGVLRQRFAGWQAHVLAGSEAQGWATGLRARAVHHIANGPLPCLLLHIDVPSAQPQPAAPSEFARRLAKNARHRRKWARLQALDCYRLYDADIPAYAFVIDRYGDWVQVAEYQPPPEISPSQASCRLGEVLQSVAEITGVPPSKILLKTRRRQRGGDQVQRRDDLGRRLVVREGPCLFWVNLGDYLDTGLFLDQRRLRGRLAADARNASLLNLFAYTATATLHAIAGGARRTVSVDSSRAYLAWAADNFALNGVQGGAHELVRADCRAYLAGSRERFDRILLGPPTFSSGRGRGEPLVLERDHAALIHAAAELLAPGGILYFTCHARGFRLDHASLQNLEVVEISQEALDQDCARGRGQPRAFLIRGRNCARGRVG